MYLKNPRLSRKPPINRYLFLEWLKRFTLGFKRRTSGNREGVAKKGR